MNGPKHRRRTMLLAIRHAVGPNHISVTKATLAQRTRYRGGTVLPTGVCGTEKKHTLPRHGDLVQLLLLVGQVRQAGGRNRYSGHHRWSHRHRRRQWHRHRSCHHSPPCCTPIGLTVVQQRPVGKRGRRLAIAGPIGIEATPAVPPGLRIHAIRHLR